MRDWLKTYGWLAGACLAAGWFSHELGFHWLFLTMFAVGGAVIVVGILSIIFPVLNQVFKWAKVVAAKVISTLRSICMFVSEKVISGVAFLIRPAIKVVITEMIDELELPVAMQNWLACQKKYFDPQRADLQPLLSDGFCAIRIVFSCSSTSPYWRAGLLLAGSDYDPARDSIFGGLLIHLASDSHNQPIHLYVYEGAKIVKHEVGSRDRGPYHFDVRFTTTAVAGDLNTAIISVDGFEACSVFTTRIGDWLANPFLLAWADGRDFRVRFQDIRVQWVAHDFGRPPDGQTGKIRLRTIAKAF